MDKKIIVLVIAVVIFVSGCTGANTGNTVNNQPPQNQPQTTGEIGINLGNLAPDFSFTDIEGNTIKLSDLRGKYVLFASMATWCTPCQIEARNVRQAQLQLENPGILKVIQYGVDPRETNQDLQNFRDNFGRDDWIMGFDDGSISSLYNIRTFDTTLIVDPEGIIIYRDEGWPIAVETLKGLVE